MASVTPWHFILAVLAGWVHREQLKVIEYLKTENRALREQLGNKRLRFTDDQRRRLAVKGHALGRKALRELGCIVTPTPSFVGTASSSPRNTTGASSESPGDHERQMSCGTS
jgi:hypothetical protein